MEANSNLVIKEVDYYYFLLVLLKEEEENTYFIEINFYLFKVFPLNLEVNLKIKISLLFLIIIFLHSKVRVFQIIIKKMVSLHLLIKEFQSFMVKINPILINLEVIFN